LEYNDKVLTHFYDPQNVGYIEGADGIGKLGDASCGDVFTMFIVVEQDQIMDIKYLVQGCGAAVATCSALSVIAKGMSIREAMELDDNDIAEELDGLPLAKLHCSNLAATVLHRTIEDYRQRRRVNLQDWRSMYQTR
jgi:nitrogen fixation NifU-like protein